MSVEEITRYINQGIKDTNDHVSSSDVYYMLCHIFKLPFRKTGRTHYLDGHVVVPNKSQMQGPSLNGLYNPVSSTSPSSSPGSPTSPSGSPQNSTISSQMPVVSLGKN